MADQAQGRPPRSLASYLLVPRPKDLVKGLLIPTTFVLGSLGVGGFTGMSVLRAVIVLIAVELLIYPARYQWNDIRGFASDQQHPSSKDRGRLPGPISRARAHVGASCAVMAARLVLVGLLVALLPGLDLGPTLGLATLGVFGVAVVYEMLRSTSTGRTGDIPAPMSAGIVSLWITAGAGYAVRGLTGLALAIDLTVRPSLAVAAAVTLWAYGVAFVTSRWALEATAFASVVDGQIVWHAHAGQAREHLLALVRWLPKRLDTGCSDVRDWAPLRESRSLLAPWHLALILAGGAAALSGLLLCGEGLSGRAVGLTAVGILATVVIVLGAPWRAMLIVTGGAALFISLVVMGAPHPHLGVLPWLLLMGAYLFYSTRTLRLLGRPSPLGVAISRLASNTGQYVVGEATWAAVTDDSQSRMLAGAHEPRM
jgi:hypothetical protein